MEETIYYQGSYIVEKYLDKFQSLILEVNYTNSCTLVVKFCKNLYNTIQNQITTLPIGKPDDTDSTAWFKAI